MSQAEGDNHFVSARERDLKPLLSEAAAALELDDEQARLTEAFLSDAWLSGARNGHAKLLNRAIRTREDPSHAAAELPTEPPQLASIEAELKTMMEASAEALNLSVPRTLELWDFLSRAWIAGVYTYESEVMASLIERRSDVSEEARRWLEGDGQ